MLCENPFVEKLDYFQTVGGLTTFKWLASDGTNWLFITEKGHACPLNGRGISYWLTKKPDYREWTLKDVPIGQTVTHKSGELKRITGLFVNEGTFHIYLNGIAMLPKKLLEEYTIDGKPCGVEIERR